MDVEIVTGADPEGWSDLVASDESATFFHTAAWGRLLSDTFPGFTRVYYVARESGRLVAGIPAVRRTLCGVAVLASMPFGTFGGPTLQPGAPGGAAAGILRAFAEAGGNDLPALAAIMRAPRSEVSPEELSQVAMPVLIVAGGDDVLVGDPRGLGRAIVCSRCQMFLSSSGSPRLEKSL